MFEFDVMVSSKMRDNVERWMIHEGLSFENVKNDENSFQILVKHAGPTGIPVDIFEPKGQPGILVIGSRIAMKNKQVSRYLSFTEQEKSRFEKKVADFCYTIKAINKNMTEDGKLKIGVYVVLDKPEDINQQTVFEAVDRVSDMYEKTARFLLKTF